MTYKSKAPLRIGLAGGGTDVSPFCDWYGGAVLNATISLYARATLETIAEQKIILSSTECKEPATFDLVTPLPINGQLDLLKAVCNCMQKDYGRFPCGIRLSAAVDVPPGSGLGGSSTLVVALVSVLAELQQVSLRPDEIAQYAYHIERNYLGWAGGKQDQYAAAFGGINYMTFDTTGVVTVSSVPLRKAALQQLENNLLLFYTAQSRKAEQIIREQRSNVTNGVKKPLEAMHLLTMQAQKSKEALLQEDLDQLGEILDFGFQQKCKMADGISNALLDDIYRAARKAGASGGKISGAGGGGFMLFYCPGKTKEVVIESLRKFGGYCQPFRFVEQGVMTWRIETYGKN